MTTPSNLVGLDSDPGQIHRLVMIRHGRSEGNVAQQLIRQGKSDEIPEGFFDVPNRELRLTPDGVLQCKPTGEFLAREYQNQFDLIVTADFIRSYETMVNTLRAAGWKVPALRTETLYGERIWGMMPKGQAEVLRELDMRRRDPFNWFVGGGETLSFTRLRSRVMFERAKRSMRGLTMGLFTHGEFMEASLAEAYHMDTETFRKFRKSKDGDIDNCQVIELSSVNPETNKPAGKLRWIRSSCPQKGKFGKWKQIVRKTQTLDEIEQIVESHPRLFKY